MDLSHPYFVEDFAKALQNQTVAVFVGAGLSRAAGYPDWKALVQDLANRLGLPPSEDLITLATFAVNRDRGRSLMNRRIVEEFSRRRTPTAVHQQLAALPFKTYWTTNYDHLIEEALEGAGKRPEVKKTQEDLPRQIPDTDVTLYKMHGDAETPQEAVLTRDDYEDYARNRELFVDVLTADLLAKTFVFLGVSFTDPNVNFLIARLRSIFDGARKEHYWVTRKPDSNDSDAQWFNLRVDDLQRYGIKTIAVREYSELNGLFDQIRFAYDRRRRERTVFVSGSVADGDERAQFMQVLVEELSTSLVRSGATIVTGLGHGLGSYIATAALNEIYRDGRPVGRADQLIARPFPIGSSRDSAKREQHRRRMLTEAGFAIFIGGRGELSPGVMEEYRLSKQMGCLPIPIGATGNTAAVIWKEVMANGQEVYGSRWRDIAANFERLNDTSLSPSAVSTAVIHILESLRF